MQRRVVTLLLVVATVAALAATVARRAASPSAPQVAGSAVAATHLTGQHVVLHKSPTCGCCTEYAEALRAAGVVVRLVDGDAALAAAKRRHAIPVAGYSCHTFELAGYVVEGHIPLEALERLLAERPAIDGLVLPGMPVGTPGMPGEKSAPFEVLALKGGRLSPYMTL